MLLCIDIGNTDCVFGIHNGELWNATWRIPSDVTAQVDDFQEKIRIQLTEHGIESIQIETVIISSVVPTLTPILQKASDEIFSTPPLLFNAANYSSLPLEVLNPTEIGTDLVANSLAAYLHFGRACVVVDFGTALTFTAIDTYGSIRGVAIAPGLKTAMFSLFANAAQLPEVPLELPESVLGVNTTHALQAGVLIGYVGLVEGILDRIEGDMGVPLKVAATGGLSDLLTPLHDRFDMRDKMLTLEGLRKAAGFLVDKL